jgi:putative ABC transport system substrate-binding protein
MNRREFAAGFCATAILSQTTAAQTPSVRRLGILSGLSAGDPQARARLAALLTELRAAGWEDKRNLNVMVRYAPGVSEGTSDVVQDLLSFQPEAVLAQGSPAWTVRNQAPSLPIVFVGVPDPMRLGFVDSLARPGGTLTGFTSTEPSIGAKWLSLLQEISPSTKSVTVMAGGSMDYFSANIVTAGALSGVAVRLVVLRGTGDIEPALAEAAALPNAGLILPTDIFTTTHRRTVIDAALRLKLPLVTGNPPYPQDGGLLYYGADFIDLYRRAAGYIDLLLRGAKPAHLPIQQPTAFQLGINLKTAQALGLTVPPVLLARADEVIE